MTPDQRKNIEILRNIVNDAPPPPIGRPYQWRWGFFMILTVCVTSIVVTGLITHG